MQLGHGDLVRPYVLEDVRAEDDLEVVIRELEAGHVHRDDRRLVGVHVDRDVPPGVGEVECQRRARSHVERRVLAGQDRLGVQCTGKMAMAVDRVARRAAHQPAALRETRFELVALPAAEVAEHLVDRARDPSTDIVVGHDRASTLPQIDHRRGPESLQTRMGLDAARDERPDPPDPPAAATNSTRAYSRSAHGPDCSSLSDAVSRGQSWDRTRFFIIVRDTLGRPSP